MAKSRTSAAFGTVAAAANRPALMTSEEGHSIRINDDYNVPVILWGDIVYVDPTRPPMIGRSVCIRFRDGTAIVTRLRSHESGVVRAESWAGELACYQDNLIEAVHPVAFHRVGTA